jgi:hypothetical protein
MVRYPRADLVPHLSLLWACCGTGGASLIGGRPLRSAEVGVGGVRRRHEVSRSLARIPATLLDAAHRHTQLDPHRDEDRRVDRPVLTRAADQLARIQQHRLVAGVADQDVVDAPLFVDLADKCAVLLACARLR